MSVRVLLREFLSLFPMFDGLFRRFIWSKVHFPEAEMRFLDSLRPGLVDITVDVGAALGAYSWVLNRVSRRVYAFEPGLVHHQYLQRVVFCTNITLVRAAVGRVGGRVRLYTPGSDSNARHLATASYENPISGSTSAQVEEVEQIALDAFLGKRVPTDRAIDVIKIDVEGYEFEVLRGGLHIISRHHPLIICEIEARHNPRYAEVFGLLRGLGYECFILRHGIVESFAGEEIKSLQLDSTMRRRDAGDPGSCPYINNFVFQHPQSRLKVSQ